MPAWITRCALALGTAVALFTVSAVQPALAAGPAVAAGYSAPALPHGAPATPAAVRLASAYLRQHPIQGRVTVLPKPGLHLPPAPALPRAGALAARTGFESAWFQWWGIRVYLTYSDLHYLFIALTVYGFNAVADAICAGGGPLALVCGAVGVIGGYIVAQAVWNTGGWRWGCGLYIDILWNAIWRTWGC